MTFSCWKCGETIQLAAGSRVGSRDTCSRCNADLHSCRNCSFYDPSKNNQCSEPQADWVRDKKLNVLVQVALDPEPELTKLGVPQIWKYIARDDDRKIAELIISQQVFQRSYIAPPDLPPASLETLRSAFDATMADKQFLQDAESMRIDIEPLSGGKVQDLVQKLYSTPKDIVERARQAVMP